ncbi:MAG: ABC transporter substrate-binding protein [Oscillospiraceae bacterium]|nr:ABC transporter substrate-binding protein [Oscillospiraceae bacterium]
MKKVLCLALALCLLFAVLSGCKKTDNEESYFTVAIAQDLDDTLDPHLVVAAGTKEVMFNVFEGLLKPTPEGNLVPAVCSSYTVDGTKYTFTLRDGIKFHNGRPVTAEDVVYSITRCRDGGYVSAFSNISEVKGEGNTVTITLKEPMVEFAAYLTCAIIPRDYADQATAPIGTGPYKFVSRSAQENVILQAFDDYWGAKPKIRNIRLRIIENGDSLLMSLKSGAVDMASHLTSTQVKGLGDGFDIVQGNMNLVQALYLNNVRAPFDDIRVRQALSYAIDKHEIINHVFDGYGSPLGSSMYPAFSKYFLPELTDYYKTDVQKARDLLKEAGYENLSFRITVPSNYQPHMDTATVIVEQLKRAGINASIEPVEWETWVSRVYSGRDFETTVVGFDASTMTARALLERFGSANGKNFIGYKSEKYDELLKKALAEYDDAKQTEYFKAMERDLTENAANVYIQDLADLVAVRKGVSGVRFYPIYVLDLSGLEYEGK